LDLGIGIKASHHALVVEDIIWVGQDLAFGTERTWIITLGRIRDNNLLRINNGDATTINGGRENCCNGKMELHSNVESLVVDNNEWQMDVKREIGSCGAMDTEHCANGIIQTAGY